jgi:oxygen-independent coproporphyrinogen-3 oxidase
MGTLDISDNDVRDLVQRYATRGPRYTSYPTAPQWQEAPDQEWYRQVLREYQGTDPMAVYVHIPFCRRLCLYCGCNVRITTKQNLVERYLAAVRKELDTVTELMGSVPQMGQLHFGGGTPTYLSAQQLGDLIDYIDSKFENAKNVERSIEVDPRITTVEQLEMLRSKGFQRISGGVQDLDEDVQKAVKREYSEEKLVEFIATARKLGFEGVNVDLMYGLPFQTEETWRRTLDAVIEMRPDRLAVFGYAHVPWLKRHQKALERYGLPSAEDRLSLAIQCRRAFVDAGYLPIGMDHFALPHDDLSKAFLAGTVHRNFMGYTVLDVDTMVAFGVSAIGDFPASYVHNHTNTDTYIEMIEKDGLAVAKQHPMSEEDRLRRRVIVRLMGNFTIDRAAIEKEFGISFDDYFAQEVEQLDEFVRQGILTREDQGWRATLPGTMVIRNVAMAFDNYLEPDHRSAQRYSHTI